MKKLLSLLITALCLCMANRAAAQGFSAANNDGVTIYYRVTSSTAPHTVEVTRNPDKYTGNVVIPASVVYGSATYAVTEIDEQAFFGYTGLISVIIPNSVTSIGNYAFHTCTGLTSVTIPNSVTKIGREAFSGCARLTSIHVDVDNMHYSSKDGVLFNKDKTTLVDYPKGKTGRYIIPNSVTSIGGWAFSNCSGLTSITIPNSVTSISGNAFYKCSGLTSVTIPNSVKVIDHFAFSDCWRLTSVTIPNSVTKIDWGAFEGCTGLTSVIIPHSVTEIGDAAFSGCTGLTSVTIPNSVTSIGVGAFDGCTGLLSITINAALPPRCEEGAFDEVSKSIPVYVPCGSLANYNKSEWWNSFTNIIEDCNGK